MRRDVPKRILPSRGARAHAALVQKLREFTSEAARYERDRNRIHFASAASMRDVDLLVEDIESGLASVADLTVQGSTRRLFVAGSSGFMEDEDWELG